MAAPSSFNSLLIRRARGSSTGLMAEIPTYTDIEGDPQLNFVLRAEPILNQGNPSIYVCATCSFRENRVTPRGSPELHVPGISQLHLPGFLSWVNIGNDAAGVNLNPEFITRFPQPVSTLLNTHMELQQGGSTQFGERVPFAEFGDLPEDDGLMVPVFCNYCHDRVGFQMLQRPYGAEDTFQSPLLDMGSVVEIHENADHDI